MGRCVNVEIAGKEYPMSFSLMAAKKIVAQYGSIEKAKTAMKEVDDVKKLETISGLLELLISQGCAYKNHFEKDLPAPENAPIIDGKWTPLPREILEMAIQIKDVEPIAEKIKQCMGQGSEKTVTAKATGKNADATQG